MAEETIKQQEMIAGDKAEKASRSQTYLPWIILAVVVPVFAGAGVGLARLLASSSPSARAGADQTAPEYTKLFKEDTSSSNTWFYPLESVVVNLNDPGATRYVRIGLTLEIDGQFTETQGGKDFLDKRKVVIKDWMTVYLASQSLKDIQGERNMRRILEEVKDGLNDKLFSKAKPVIVNVLYNENAIQ